MSDAYIAISMEGIRSLKYNKYKMTCVLNVCEYVIIFIQLI